VKNGSDLERFRLGPIHNQIRVDGEKFHILLCQILAAVPCSWSSCEKSDSFADSQLHAIRQRDARLLFNVTPDFDEVECGLWRKNVAHAHLSLVFQFR
jgi:hypothetical protein